jgi:PAS domain S-box-containing protein
MLSAVSRLRVDQSWKETEKKPSLSRALSAFHAAGRKIRLGSLFALILIKELGTSLPELKNRCLCEGTMRSKSDLKADRFLRFVGKCNSWPLGWRLAAAAALVLLATLLRALLTIELGNKFVYISYFPAVAIAAMMTGVAGGVFATLLSVFFVNFRSAAEYDLIDLVRTIGFVGASAVVIVMAKLIEMGRERLAALEEARHDEERQRQFIEQAPVALAMLDENRRYVAISRRWRDEYDLGGQNIIGRSHDEVRPKISGDWKQIHQQGLSGMIVRAEEDLFHHADGRPLWLRWEVRPWYRDGSVAGIIIFSEDVTVRKQAEEKVNRSDAQFRAMFENSAVGMAQVSPDGHFLRVNERLCEMFGYSQAELQGLSFQDVMQPDDLATEITQLKHTRALDTDRYGQERRCLRKDGLVMWGYLSVGDVFDENGKLAYQVAVIEDITERKRTEDALRKFSRVIRQTASAVVITDAEGIIEYVNPKFSEITGYSAAEAVGRRPDSLNLGPLDEATASDIWRTIKSGQIWRGEFQSRRKDGSSYWDEAIVSPIRDSRGEITHFAAIQDDITERNEIAKQFAAAQRMESVGRLAGGIAHDFNNLLAVITGNLELIEQRSDNDRIKALVGPALDAARAGAAFNRRLLSISGHRRFGSLSFIVNSRIRDMSVLLERIFDPQVLLKYDLAEDLWPSIADAGELDSAVLNLVINSRDAMPQGGEIIIRTCNVSLDADHARRLSKEAHAGDYVCISVIDDGEGMSPEVLERAMEPFFTTKFEEGRGTGLGLSSVQNFAAEFGGFVGIESRKNEGTCVNLFLPRAPAEERSEGLSTRREEMLLGNGEYVLVVEDDERVREVTLKRVEALGYVAEAARSGSEAIALLQSGIPVDLVLSDVVMPAMSGFDMAHRIRAERPEVKIVFATGYSGEPLARNEPLGDIRLLYKPYTREQLAGALAEALASPAQIRETSLVNT